MCRDITAHPFIFIMILFLDLDGVVNCAEYLKAFKAQYSTPKEATIEWRKHHTLHWVVPELANRVSSLCDEFDLSIVLISSWRVGNSIEELKELFKTIHLPAERLIGKTITSRDRNEVEEITTWLIEHEQDSFIIISDDWIRDMPSSWKFFQTTYEHGFTEEVYQQVRTYLTNKGES